jgi:hypothetical protein
MKTAVEWYCEKSVVLSEDLRTGKIDFIKWFKEQADIFKQAKEMEKEQIVNAFEIGYDNGACVQEGNAIYHGSNYYNETFKSE